MNNTFVGLLRRLPHGALIFKYDEKWVYSPGGVPLSLSLPLTTKTYSGSVVLNYFGNLLPDSERTKRILAKKMAFYRQEDFDLLAAIGRDCVGAVQLFPREEEVAPDQTIQATPVSEKDIEEILKNLKNHPLGISAEDRFRISMAGSQEKTAFLKLDDQWYLPHGSTPTSHIFKAQMGVLRDGVDLSQSVENEWLCLQICKEFGLPVAHAEMAEFGSVKALIVERFDREYAGSLLLRYAQEDLCQVCGISSTQKYEYDGGPGIVEITEILTRSDNPTLEKTIFMKSQIVFWLLAALEGHAKNFSVFLVPGGIRLAPIYDVKSAHPLIEKKQLSDENARFAMAVGDDRHYLLREIKRQHWLQTAKRARFAEADMRRLLDEIAEHTPTAVSNVLSKLPVNFPQEVSHPIFSGMLKAASLLQEEPSYESEGQKQGSADRNHLPPKLVPVISERHDDLPEDALF